ncbi:hypothetical protein KsCSTR_05080 [Candidatus Kuenenia stuttgartiensis]|uniref:Uncharacterized protein n=1 Tax=Kuenenia stuttgartiensis TaxID=174633 RepID=Q1Q071_KUEST|nr:hypothetical protein KsCSTR_05080 [Candidatus Kuenenia stuttgartiensis]CAJ72734.1 unknown protein [Candidatus Kuenenia stuttgartiensis]
MVARTKNSCSATNLVALHEFFKRLKCCLKSDLFDYIFVLDKDKNPSSLEMRKDGYLLIKY